VVSAPHAAGLFYGMLTLGQLLTRDGDDWTVPAVRIDDAPRFEYRGVMLDVARHFHAVETVEAYIERAAALKFNALHLHLSDDQGWRLQLRSRPALTERAAGTACFGDEGGFYTADDYARIVEFAAARHMIVVPEFDMPGHTHAVGLAYPEIVEEPVIAPHVLETVEAYGGGVPAKGEPYTGLAVGFSSLRIHDEATYDFVADVFGELARMTPGPYLHLGGDECLGTKPEDFAEFMARATGIVADLGKTPMTWHEAGSAAGICDDTVGQYWGLVQPDGVADEKARTFVRNGSRLVLSPADAIYLDMKSSADGPGLTWANGVTTVERSYAWEPTELIEGVDEDDILGVEAPLWSELVRTPADIDAMAFPRIASAAEIAWSPAATASPARTWESFRVRVGALGPLWAASGIGFTRTPEIPWAG
jgi:N-acetyl-beta-hexosaminidase